MGPHTPLEAVSHHGVKVGLGGPAARLAAGLDAGGVHPLQQLRIGAGEGQPGAFMLQVPVYPGLHIAGVFLEHGGVRPEEALPGGEVVPIVGRHVPGSAVEARGHAQPGEGGVFDMALNAGGLPRPDVQAHLHQQVGVFAELRFKIFHHWVNLLLDKLSRLACGGLSAF